MRQRLGNVLGERCTLSFTKNFYCDSRATAVETLLSTHTPTIDILIVGRIRHKSQVLNCAEIVMNFLFFYVRRLKK